MDVQLFIDRLLESENLTDNLDDEAANTLIKWGIRQVDPLIKDKDDETAGTQVNHLMALMRSINSLAGKPSRVNSASLVKFVNRFNQTFDKDHQIDEEERRKMAQQISAMQSKGAVDYLLQWMDSKR